MIRLLPDPPPYSWDKIKKKQSLFVNCIVLIISVIISLILAELIFRGIVFFQTALLLDGNTKGIYENNYYLGFKLKANYPLHYSLSNSIGFNDIEYSFNKPQNTTRIFVVGDSQTYGVVGYDSNFLTLLENELNKKNNNKIEIINAGVPSYNLNQYLDMVRHYGYTFNPDIILLNLYTGNDFNYFYQTVVFNGKLIPRKKHSFLLIDYLWFLELTRKSKLTWGVHDSKTIDPWIPEEKLIKIYNDTLLGFTEENIKTASETVINFNTELKNKNIKLVITLIPYKVQVDKNLKDKFNDHSNINNLYLPNRLLKEKFERYNVSYIDFTPYLNGSHYYAKDTHLNIEGNYVLMQVLNDTLKNIS